MDINGIKTKVEKLKTDLAKAQGGAEAIEADWTKTYGFNDVQAVEAKIAVDQKTLEELRLERASVVTELQEMADWDNL